MTFKTWLLFLLMETALSLSPARGVLCRIAGRRGALRRSLPAAAGIIARTGDLFHALGNHLGAIIAASARFFTIASGWVRRT